MHRLPLPVLVLLASLANAHDIQLDARSVPPGTISVSGTARVLVVPDEVVVSMSAQAYEKDLALAKSSTDAGIAAVRSAVRDLKIPDDRVQTDSIDISVDWRTSDNRPAYGAENRYFKVQRGITVILSSPEQLDGLLTRSLAGGITSVDGIVFRTSRLAELRASARLQAAQAARAKAEALATALGAHLDRATAISEQDNRWYWGGSGRRNGAMPMQNIQLQIEGGGDASMEGGVAPGRIAIDATISVQFLLAP